MTEKGLKEGLLKRQQSMEEKDSESDLSSDISRTNSSRGPFSRSMVHPKRSILKRGDSLTSSEARDSVRSMDKNRISYNEKIIEVHEVENWKKFNSNKPSCGQRCLEECALI